MAGKRAVVVGGGQIPGHLIGIGRAIAESLALEGSEVCVVDRALDRAEATAASIVDAGGKAHALEADVSDPAECARLVDDARALMGGIDVLVNNVGTEHGDNDEMTLDVENWQRIMDINVRSMWLTSRAVVPVMEEGGGGCIVNTSSIGARIASGGLLFAYGVSKATVDALTRKLAVAWGPRGVRCNSVLPGYIITQHAIEGIAQAGVAVGEEEVREFGKHSNPLGRIGTGWDIGKAVAFLASDDALHITGVNLPVDGGACAST
jgi:NAD(P)-dependent dehydrogenase (short-subunit alcohol dehydrogenase family)